MSNAYYEKVESIASAPLHPPPYSEEEPSALGYEVLPATPPEYQPYCGVPREGCRPGAALCPPQAVFITTVLPPRAPDYLGYSIFTMVCCFLPLGIAAFVCAITTRVANHSGDDTAARRNSRLALLLANTAFGVGLALWILSITIVLW